MPRVSFLRSALVLTTAFGLAACGDDDTSATPSAPVTPATTTPRTGISAEPSEYCQAVFAFQEVTDSFDASDVQSALDTFGASAAAARDVADVAPAEVRAAHDTLASASELLLRRLRDADPQTLDELNTASEELLTEVEAEYGDLQDETDHVEAYTTAECGPG